MASIIITSTKKNTKKTLADTSQIRIASDENQISTIQTSSPEVLKSLNFERKEPIYASIDESSVLDQEPIYASIDESSVLDQEPIYASIDESSALDQESIYASIGESSALDQESVYDIAKFSDDDQKPVYDRAFFFKNFELYISDSVCTNQHKLGLFKKAEEGELEPVQEELSSSKGIALH